MQKISKISCSLYAEKTRYLKMDYHTHELSNGIRLIYMPVTSLIAHAGLFINTGSRDEKNFEHGMAHYLEHVFFKGTKKRKAYHILSRLEDVGGELNAFTTKEDTCIHASFLKEDLERALELISDIAWNATFPEKEIEKEKEVIIDEINSYKDNPSELIFDDFDEMIYPNHPLGRNILGTPESLKSFHRKEILDFIQSNYETDKMVVCVVGALKKEYVFKIFEKHFKDILACAKNRQRSAIQDYEPAYLELNKNTYQTHCIIGARTFSYQDPRRLTLHLMSNLLGGPGMSSRLNLSLRERNAYSYNIDSSYTPYSDTGIFNIYFGTDKENLQKCLKLIQVELDLLKNKPLSTIQFSKAKKQLVGQLAIAAEQNENMMITLGKSYMIYNKVDTLEEIYKQIEEITAIQLMDVANEVLDNNRFSTIIYK
jgi:predicted Zn-dependent peptidase